MSYWEMHDSLGVSTLKIQEALVVYMKAYGVIFFWISGSLTEGEGPSFWFWFKHFFNCCISRISGVVLSAIFWILRIVIVPTFTKRYNWIVCFYTDTCLKINVFYWVQPTFSKRLGLGTVAWSLDGIPGLAFALGCGSEPEIIMSNFHVCLGWQYLFLSRWC